MHSSSMYSSYVLLYEVENTTSHKINEIKDNVDIDETDIFIYGTFKEDFKTIDYKSLYAINLQATKDLYKTIKDLQNRLSILENK